MMTVASFHGTYMPLQSKHLTTPYALLGSAKFHYSLATQTNARSPQLRLLWPRAWRLISRHVTSIITCGVACQALGTILEFKLIKYSEIDDTVDGMLASTDFNGPAACDRTATKLWALLLRLRRSESIANDLEVSSSILRWLCRCWSPGESGRVTWRSLH